MTEGSNSGTNTITTTTKIISYSTTTYPASFTSSSVEMDAEIKEDSSSDMDIDKNYHDNPMAMTDYVDDIYEYYWKTESPPHWGRILIFHTTYSEEDLLECSRLMVEFHRNAEIGKLPGVHRKYSTSKFGCVAKSEPALFLLQ
ncbi:hypothetical protein ZOSMA_412G00020 [Zostera marina]|uniref:Cyclin C-terminal domain-containing protein n=1 Tax=Zostera marina TaxID=29655 RepID=A0A0K9P584_ZOSMR|nr:hypothetical protein ZOSMA_412G00020 [Zostera marina]